MCSSPWLIAACHVLLRLLMPRHSPCALSSLTSSAQIFYLRLLALAHPIRWASLGLGWLSRIMQASDSVHCSFVVTHFRFPQITLLPLCCLLQSLDCFTVQFSRCRSPTLFKVRLKCSGDCLNTSIQSCGGGYRTRTGDPLLAKQVFYQLN